MVSICYSFDTAFGALRVGCEHFGTEIQHKQYNFSNHGQLILYFDWPIESSQQAAVNVKSA